MSLNLKKIVEYSAHCINCINYIAIVKVDKADLVRRVRTRARQLFEVLTYQGLPYLFAYVGGKAGEKSLQVLYDVLCKDGNAKQISKELEDKISNELKLSNEDASYALYGASILCVLSKVMRIDLKCSLEELIYKYGFDRFMQKLSYEVAKWLKFFSEAKLPE